MAICIHEKISLVHIRMEETIADGVPEETLDDVIAQRFEIKSFCAQGRDI